MVAPEPVRKAPQPQWQLSGPAPENELPDTVNMPVKEVRALLASLRRPDIRLLCRLTRDPRVTVRDLAFHQLARERSLSSNEDLFRQDGARLVAGTDEAGRGALAGPLTAAAVVFEPGTVVDGVKDSKLLSPGNREELYVEILARARGVSVVFMDPSTIDRWGLNAMNLAALGDALAGLACGCDVAIVDHFRLAGLDFPAFGIPHADEIFQSVASASIVAKVERDRVMRAMHHRFPRYCFEKNKGYGTAEHLRALDEHGPCEIHRLSFAGVSEDSSDVRLWEDEDAT
jgi:ribonuclease HII